MGKPRAEEVSFLRLGTIEASVLLSAQSPRRVVSVYSFLIDEAEGRDETDF